MYKSFFFLERLPISMSMARSVVHVWTMVVPCLSVHMWDKNQEWSFEAQVWDSTGHKWSERRMTKCWLYPWSFISLLKPRTLSRCDDCRCAVSTDVGVTLWMDYTTAEMVDRQRQISSRPTSPSAPMWAFRFWDAQFPSHHCKLNGSVYQTSQRWKWGRGWLPDRGRWVAARTLQERRYCIHSTEI